MKPVRWSPHALDGLSDRGIDRAEADLALAAPELVTPGAPKREVYMRRYFDASLGEQMLLRVVVEETLAERIVVTVYKTSRIRKYLGGLGP